MAKENWKKIEMENLNQGEIYEVSDQGKIRYSNDNGKNYEELSMTPPVDGGKGHKALTWIKGPKGGKRRITKPLHRIVAQTFVPREDYQNYVIHLDFDKNNNSAKNLQWVTRAQVSEHLAKDPKRIEAKKTQKHIIRNAKLNEQDVLAIKRIIKEGKTPLYKVAKQYGISHTQLNKIRKGENWAHVKLED